MNKAVIARDALMDIVKKVRATYPEDKQDEIINPLETAIYALAKLA